MSRSRLSSAAYAALFATLGLLPAGGVEAADAFPTHYVTIVVPNAPGGASDFAARIIQPGLQERWKQPIVIENRAGATGNVGMAYVAKAAPDGYTLLLGNVGQFSINPSVYGKEMKVNPLTDLAAVTLLAEAPGMLIAAKSFPPNTVKEFIAYAKANPGKVNFASPGSGSLNRLEMEQFRLEQGMDMVHIPYKGGASQATADIVGGQVPVMFTTVSTAINFVKAGQVKALALKTAQRLPALPDVPTMEEAGFPNMVSGTWLGIAAPAKTPPEVVAKLHADIVAVLDMPDVKQRFENGGVQVRKNASPKEFADYIASEEKRWRTVVERVGATPDD
jgi:tripartite-type tricarboxylate transporter receptor subunit TctC